VRPVYRLVANDEDITATIRDRLISLRLSDSAGLESDSLDIKITDHDPSAPILLPPRGAELRLWIGYDDAATEMGLFVVDKVEMSGPPDHITIKAKASIQAVSGSGAGSTRSTLTTQKTRSWPAGLTLGEMVYKMAAEHGLDPAVADSLAFTELPHVDQVNESDISLLTRLSRGYGAIVKPAGGKLVVAERGASKTVSGQSLPTVAIARQDVSKWRVQLDERVSAGKVIAVWRDLEGGVDREVSVGDGDQVRRLRHAYGSEAEANKAARAEYEGANRGESSLSLTMPGDPRLIAEARVSLSGFRSGVAGTWLITKADHTLDGAGYRTSISCDATG